jgi:hypothetical protein
LNGNCVHHNRGIFWSLFNFKLESLVKSYWNSGEPLLFVEGPLQRYSHIKMVNRSQLGEVYVIFVECLFLRVLRSVHLSWMVVRTIPFSSIFSCFGTWTWCLQSFLYQRDYISFFSWAETNAIIKGGLFLLDHPSYPVDGKLNNHQTIPFTKYFGSFHIIHHTK